jgi:hypothetical protein
MPIGRRLRAWTDAHFWSSESTSENDAAEMRVTIAGSPHSVKPRTAPGSPPRAAATATTICPRESGRKQQRNTPASSRRRRPRARAEVDARREPVRRPRRAVSAPRNRSLRVNPAGGHAGDFRATSPTGGLHMRTRAGEG